MLQLPRTAIDVVSVEELGQLVLLLYDDERLNETNIYNFLVRFRKSSLLEDFHHRRQVTMGITAYNKTMSVWNIEFVHNWTTAEFARGSPDYLLLIRTKCVQLRRQLRHTAVMNSQVHNLWENCVESSGDVFTAS